MLYRQIPLGLALVIAAALSAPSHSTTPPQPQVLAALYAALDGENWTDNDGWMEPDVHWCDWYGVTCGQGGSEDDSEFLGLRLSANGLRGELSEDFNQLVIQGASMPTRWLDLSHNQIEGALPYISQHSERIDFSSNRFTGELPRTVWIPPIPGSDPFPGAAVSLDLSNNAFTGAIPLDWTTYFDLQFLNLANNQLEGSIEPALEAMALESPEDGLWYNTGLWLQGNAFSGNLEAEWFEGLELGSINLCWNEIEISDPDLADWIAERHWGGDPSLCLDRERLALDPSISGSWYDVNRPGEGLSLMLLDNGIPLVYWFSHISSNRQLWLFNTGRSNETSSIFESMLRTTGEFGFGFSDAEFPLFRSATLRLDRIDSSLLHAEFGVGYTGYDLTQPGDIQITWPPLPATIFRSDHAQLSRLAGTSCDNQLEHQWISGAWFNPERAGEGFVVEVIEDGRGVVYWFTYTPAGTNDGLFLERSGDWQAWMTGDGQFSDGTLIIDPLYRPQDTGFAMPGISEFIELNPMGRLELTFSDDLGGQVSFISSDADFPSISYPIERLARPMLAECD